MTFTRMVLFGATGDLAGRLLMPACAQLAQAGLLPAGFTVTGSANDDWTTADLRQHLAARLADHAPAVPAEVRDALVGVVTYTPADVTDAADVRRILAQDSADTLVYLALPSGLLAGALTGLADAGLGSADAVAIEKPFGTDLDSARHLNELLRTRLPLPRIFRVDHFLSDELVRRVIVLRFLNRVFEPTWNAQHIERVDISWLESLALEGRARYYDHAGALRDMVQNHLLEVMSLVVMGEPARLDAASFRDARVEALRSVATPSSEQLPVTSLRARYSAGEIDGRSIPAYADEPGVDPSRGTETYASLTLQVDSTRWAGTEFTLRSGKALAADSAEVAVHYRPSAPHLRNAWPGTTEPNVLRVGLTRPYIRLSTTLMADQRPTSQELELRNDEPGRSPYANVLLELLQGDATPFIRGDEAEESWRLVDPVLDAWRSDLVPLRTYPAGGPPPN